MKSVKYIAPKAVTVLSFVTREARAVNDDMTRKSIAEVGIRQPLVVVPDGDRLLLSDGLLRLEIAESEGIAKVPYVLDDAPRGVSPEDHARRLRFTVNFHRQDLLPSQKCAMVSELKTKFGMTNGQVAAFLGIAPDSVTNWLAVERYIEPVVEAMDESRLTMQAARAFDGMTEEGQKAIWRSHSRELMSGAMRHKDVRKKYSPEECPRYYRQPGLVASRLARKSGKRKATARMGMGQVEKEKLLKSFELRDIELKEGQAELATIKREINAAIPAISAILRNEKLLALVPKEMREELERFGEIYV